MQYPWRLPLVLGSAVWVVTAAGCVETGWVEPEPLDDCETAAKPKVLDIQLSGLEDTNSYLFAVEAEGSRVTVARTPEQQSTFGEAPLADGGALVVSLDPDTLRVFLDGVEGVGPKSVHVTAWTRDAIVADTTFMPAYEHAVRNDGDCFSTITETLALPPHE